METKGHKKLKSMNEKKLQFYPVWRGFVKHLKEDWYRYVFDTIVVILGIMIAFYLDSWYESTTRKSLTRSYATSLISDLEGDIYEVEKIQAEMMEYIARIDSLASYVRNRDTKALSNLDLFPLLTGGNRPYSWNRVTIDELKQSGVLRDKGNEALSRLIAEYEAFTKHMEEDYRMDLMSRDRVSALADEIVDLNYSNFNEIAPKYWNPNTYHVLDDNFQHSTAYTVAERDGLKLLSEDEIRLKQMVNGYLRFRFFLNIRSNVELSQLIVQAEEIISLLETQYLKHD
jgi:hypothetical protein